MEERQCNTEIICGAQFMGHSVHYNCLIVIWWCSGRYPLHFQKCSSRTSCVCICEYCILKICYCALTKSESYRQCTSQFCSQKYLHCALGGWFWDFCSVVEWLVMWYRPYL